MRWQLACVPQWTHLPWIQLKLCGQVNTATACRTPATPSPSMVSLGYRFLWDLSPLERGRFVPELYHTVQDGALGARSCCEVSHSCQRQGQLPQAFFPWWDFPVNGRNWNIPAQVWCWGLFCQNLMSSPLIVLEHKILSRYLMTYISQINWWFVRTHPLPRQERGILQGMYQPQWEWGLKILPRNRAWKGEVYKAAAQGSNH